MSTSTATLEAPRARPAVIGRGDELSLLRNLLTDPSSQPSMALLGDPGMGKTLLLTEAAALAAASGRRVVSHAGRESESALDFSALRELLLPLAGTTGALTARQRQAVEPILGTDARPITSDRLLNATAAMELLVLAAVRQPLLLVGDDIQWFDQSSLDVLAFVARRLRGPRIVLLLGKRVRTLPRSLDGVVPHRILGPLGLHDAALLVDTQPRPPRGRLREEVIRQAEGNPLALIELSRVVATDPDALHRWAIGPLPIGARISKLFERELESLPGPTRAALLQAAVADGAEVAVSVDVSALAKAEQSGLVTLDRAGAHFSHPLVRSAIYHAAPFSWRAAAHQRLAESLQDQPDRLAWHRAAATFSADDSVALLLETTSVKAQERGGVRSAALALERAAELTTSPAMKARRFVRAATLASSTGQSDWVRDLAERALALDPSPELRTDARLAQGWSLAWTNDHAGAMAILGSVALETVSTSPQLAWDALDLCATVVYQSASPEGRALLSDLLRRLEASAGHGAAGELDLEGLRAWPQAVVDPAEARTTLLPYLRRQPPLREPGLSSRLGVTAWLLDETDLAVRLLRGALDDLRRPGLRGDSGGILSALGLALVDNGTWDSALETSEEALDLGLAYGMGLVAASALVTSATVKALQGKTSAGRADALDALSHVRQQFSPAVEARVRHARGLADLADGEFHSAYLQLHGLFHATGEPLHFHVSYLGLADLAMAAVGADQGDESRVLLDKIAERAPRASSPRTAQILALARGLLADSDEAEQHFAVALADPSGERWPFERARVQLAYAEWLRRMRRINEAKGLLLVAAEAFRRLGAVPWETRAHAELRAAGTRATVGPASAVELLTPQQREVVQLAARGLSNRDIAQRLFLSPATVASHLYRSYPKLGITGRNQLSSLLAGDDGRP